MRNSIPKVRTWRAMFANGSELEVTAPTRLLAKLEIRRLGFWEPIVSLAVLVNGRVV